LNEITTRKLVGPYRKVSNEVSLSRNPRDPEKNLSKEKMDSTTTFQVVIDNRPIINHKDVGFFRKLGAIRYTIKLEMAKITANANVVLTRS